MYIFYTKNFFNPQTIDINNSLKNFMGKKIKITLFGLFYLFFLLFNELKNKES